ncbi:transporter [Haloferula sp. BvORR071]|uniref:transporter n=1 Tax=Haloferula sp. BvORR071 TaxID=1396141 RepID=UPI0009DDD4BD|nr:transporter [Haloferula sp. BvORR071]
MPPLRPPLASSLLIILAANSLVIGAELRELSTDRPDTTESPYTVDAGHFQFEMEIAAWAKDGRERELTLGELNAKVGLDKATDLQVVLPLFSHVRGGDEGFGDIEIRLKRNLWGNDEGSTALALMPYVKLPTAHDDLGNGEFEGGLIVPFGFEGPAGWSCAVMGVADIEADEDGSGHHFTAVTSATTSHDLSENTAVFLELVSILSAESGADWEAYFNTGMTWAVTPTWQLDGGVRLGLTDAATDFTPFLGVSTKF